jgi:lipoprotein-anchoring transpeptidase ErfK/SrfK
MWGGVDTIDAAEPLDRTQSNVECSGEYLIIDCSEGNMKSYSHLTFIQSSVAYCIRMASLIFCAVVIFAQSTGLVFAGQPVAPATLSSTNGKQPAQSREVGSENRKYAQFFLWPFEQNFGPPPIPTPPYTPPRQNFNTSPPPDDRYAGEAKRKIIQQIREALPPPPTTGPLLLIVSIPKQTITLYDAGVAVVVSPISSGTSENPTPTGIFSVIEKNWWHRSNIYSAAPMPYMQCINWEGVALHAGELPGYAASHGCIRLPYDFALRLWQTTRISTRVIISYDELAPIEIEHPRLFVHQSVDERTSPAEQDENVVPTTDSNVLATPESSNILNSVPPYPARSFLANAAQAPQAAQAPMQNRVLRPGPLSILVSQRDQRMYVRKGLEPVFDFPIVIAKTGRALGTHVYTAIAQNDDGKMLRWTVVSMPSSLPAVSGRIAAKSQLLGAAKEALDRLELPKEVLDRVSPLISVGATLIVTDQGLGRQASALDADYMISTR